MSGDIELRRLRENDVEAAIAVWARARWDAQLQVEERMARTPDDDRRHFREVLMRDCRIWVADESGRVVGLLALGEGSVEQLHVDPDAQGRGIGSRLLDLAKQACPSGLRLFTFQRNERARAFYEGRGFEAVRFGTSPPPESEPDVEYRWPVPPRSA